MKFTERGIVAALQILTFTLTSLEIVFNDSRFSALNLVSKHAVQTDCEMARIGFIFEHCRGNALSISHPGSSYKHRCSVCTKPFLHLVSHPGSNRRQDGSSST